jgi:hypothetical protein
MDTRSSRLQQDQLDGDTRAHWLDPATAHESRSSHGQVVVAPSEVPHVPDADVAESVSLRDRKRRATRFETSLGVEAAVDGIDHYPRHGLHRGRAHARLFGHKMKGKRS